jgi:hypothetical protein
MRSGRCRKWVMQYCSYARTWPADDPDADGAPCPRCAGNGIIERDLDRHSEAEDRPEWRPETN